MSHSNNHTCIDANSLSDSLLPSAVNNENKVGKVAVLSIFFGALVGLLVHLSTLGVHVWLATASVSSLLEHSVYWSLVSPFVISTLVVLIYVVLTSLASQLQSSAVTTLILETRFVGGFLCSLVLSSTFYDITLLKGNESHASLIVVTAISLTILFCGWLTTDVYEKARIAEINKDSEGLV